MTRSRATLIKFGVFTVVMVMLTLFLFASFGQYRGGSRTEYSALFSDVSRLKPRDTVRVAGIEVGSVNSVSLREDKKVAVTFDADPNIVLTTATRAVVRYLNLTGDRYLELVDSPGSTRVLAAGSQIPLEQTAPALDLELLLGGLKPVIRGLNAQDVNALTSSLIEVFQGQGGTMSSLLSRTTSFANAIGDNAQIVQSLIDNLNTVTKTIDEHKDEFSGAIDRIHELVAGLSADRDPIGAAIDSLSTGTASIADLLSNSRAPLAASIEQLNRLAPTLDKDKWRIDAALQKAPDNFRKLNRIGAYGSFVQYYFCGVTVRASDLQGRTAVFPWMRQDTGRCAS